MKRTRFWDRIAGIYDRQVSTVYGQAYKKTISLSKSVLKEGESLLDFACGTGITTLELAATVDRIRGIDISEGMLDIARLKAEESGIENVDFIKQDLFDAELDEERFDAVTAFNILYFLDSPEQALLRIHRLLNPGGLFLSATDCLGENPNFKIRIQLFLGRMGIIPSMKGLKRAELKNMIEAAGFTIEEIRSLHPEPPNLFIIARKQS